MAEKERLGETGEGDGIEAESMREIEDTVNILKFFSEHVELTNRARPTLLHFDLAFHTFSHVSHVRSLACTIVID